MESAPAQESRRSVFERLVGAARAVFERDRIDPEHFYEQKGFHINRDGTQSKKTFFTYNPYSKENLKNSVQEGEARAWSVDIRAVQKKVEDKNLYEENLLLGDIAEGVGYEIIKHLFAHPRFEVLPASFVDDRLNGNDIFVIERDESGNVENIFGIDITAAPEPDILAKKITQSLRCTMRGEMGQGSLLQTKSTGATEYFSSEAVTKLVLPIDEVTAVAHAQRMARNEPIPFGASRRVAELFEHQIRFHQNHAQNDAVQKVLQNARQSIGRIRASAPPDHLYEPWNNLQLLENLYTDKKLEKRLEVIANDMNIAGKAAAKKKAPLDVGPFELLFKEAVHEHMPPEPATSRFNTAFNTLRLLTARVGTLEGSHKSLRSNLDRLDAQLAVL